MDDNSELLENFENILKKHNSRQPSRLYSNDESKRYPQSEISYNQKDVIRNISAQIKAIQSADCVMAQRRVRNMFEKQNTSSFVPVNELPVPVIPPKKTAKFETQFVLDTQLINVVENVEAMSSYKGITQEFENSFEETNVVHENNSLNSNIDKIETCLNVKNSYSSECTEKNKEDNKSKSIIDGATKNDTNAECELYSNKMSMNDNCTALLDECMDVEQNVNIEDLITNTEINSSPIININKGDKSKSTSPLVYNLESFEKFEKYAIPIIEENDDIDMVKHLINSQIMNNELLIQTDFQPEFRISERRLSPVLKLSKGPKTSAEKVNKVEEDTKLKVIHSHKNSPKSPSSFVNFTDVLKKECKRESITFEDEILFSSDEEHDVKQTVGHIETKDLPFTCALETSFYEHSDVLDTTMYVGFQTASNKSIQISTASFTKAKNIFEDEADGGKVATLKELVEKCDGLNSKLVITDRTFLSGIDKEHQANIENINSEFPVIDDTNFVGFKSANGKEIEISNKSMVKAKALFSDFDNNDSINNPLKVKSFNVFKTASNKDINLSEKAMQRCKRVFQDIDLTDDCFNNFSSEIEPSIKKIKHDLDKDNIKKVVEKAYDSGIPKIDDDLLQEFEGEMSLDNITMHNKDKTFIRFKTASNKEIAVSDTALKKSKKILDDIDWPESPDKIISSCNATSNNSNSKNNNFGFKTASNKYIHISEKALAKTKTIFQDIDLPDQESKSKEACKNHTIEKYEGFKTASNKEIKISEEAISKTKNLFQDIESGDAHNPFQINKNATDLFENFDSNKPSTSKTGFAGFRTANNHTITISTRALEKSKSIFQDLDNLPLKSIQNEHPMEDIDAALIQDRKLSEEFDHDFKSTVEESNSDVKANNNNPVGLQVNKSYTTECTKNVCGCHKLGGFQTASNKLINVSKGALTKSRTVFQDILNDKDIDLSESNFRSCQTANKEIHYSTDDLAKSNNFIEDVELNHDKKYFHGFKTASNKDVKISAKAIARSKKIFEDLDEFNNEFGDNKNNTNPVFKGFQTASNKDVKISVDSLAKSRKLFEDLETVHDTDTKICEELKTDNNFQIKRHKGAFDFKGFRTASNKEAKISAVALQSKEIFKGIEAPNVQPCFLSFQTAANKEIEISNELLSKSKQLLDDSVCNIETLENDGTPKGFRGFQTASSKEVTISTEALARSRKIFHDLSGFEEKEFSVPNNIKQINCFKGITTASRNKVFVTDEALNKDRQILGEVNINESKHNFTKPTFGFKTANNNDVQISEEALIKSKQLLTGFQNNNDKILNSDIMKLETNTHLNEPITKPNINIDKLIDTQVICNFDQSLNTEDFRSPEKKSKRSGSPILSCPKAKRRKFATPYKIGTIEKAKDPLAKEIEICDDSYKKHKKYTLKDIEILENRITTTDVTTNIVLNDKQLDNFEFTDERNDISDSKMTIDLLKVHFFKVVNKKLIPDGWFENHIKLILWKLISYEIKFPKAMSGICTAKNVLDQLKYRYYKELYNAERPALRKIFEKDDVASKTMVLCVREIYNDGGENSATNQTELLLTDGWYSIRACADKMLTKCVMEGRIRIGTKIATHGAELLNCEQGVAPWEDTSSVRLKIFGNSTRRARWDARLGYHGNAAILSHLSSVKPEGGKVSKLRVLVTRVYPPLYVEKFEDGSTVTRSERLEHIHQMKHEADRQALVEKIYEEMEKEMSDEESQDSEDVDTSKRSLDTGSQIARLLKNSREPSQFRASLTDSQRRLLEAYTLAKRDKVLQHIQDRVRSRLTAVSRNVVPLLKVRVADVSGGRVHRALLSIWKPNDAHTEIITEGACVEILNVVPTAVRYSELQLSAGRQTIFKSINKKLPKKILPFTKSLQRTCYPIKEIMSHPAMITESNEIDTIGIVIEIDPAHRDFKSTHNFQNVYLTDEERNIICVNFWGGIKKFGYENILDRGQVIACVNLQKRAGNTRKNIPQYRATEYTYFTKTPKSVEARKLIEELSKMVLKKKYFIDECLTVKNDLMKLNVSNGNISPYIFKNHDLTKNKIYIESPLARVRKEDEFNLSGLDFESTFRQTEPQELSPKSLLRKRRIHEKITKLKMYGEPPPLSPINIINKSNNATKSFKSPLLNTSVASKSETPVASAKKLPENRGENLSCSPVLSVHRTFKKGVNPIKLDFNNVTMEDNEDVDHFAEEFDASPPLSLD